MWQGRNREYPGSETNQSHNLGKQLSWYAYFLLFQCLFFLLYFYDVNLTIKNKFKYTSTSKILLMTLSILSLFGFLWKQDLFCKETP